MTASLYVGFLAEDSGFGRAARSHLLALASAGHAVRGRSILLQGERWVDVPPNRHLFRRSLELTRAAGDHDSVLVHTPPEHFLSLREIGKRNIGVTAWETERIPARWRPLLDVLDELWVPSAFCQDAFARDASCPVHVIPHPVDPIADGPRALPGIPDDTFLFVSILQWSERKNPLGLLRAFRRAFEGRHDVALLLHVGLALAEGRDVVETLAAASSPLVGAHHPRVYLCFESLLPATMDRIYRRADAYASLHRAEGFGLCLAEAMSAGAPVVATSYSGNLDFMDERSAFLVPARLVPARDELSRVRRFDPSMWWAEPDEEAAVESMRACVSSPGRRDAIAKAGRARIREQLGSPRIGALMRARLEGTAC